MKLNDWQEMEEVDFDTAKKESDEPSKISGIPIGMATRNNNNYYFVLKEEGRNTPSTIECRIDSTQAAAYIDSAIREKEKITVVLNNLLHYSGDAYDLEYLLVYDYEYVNDEYVND
jgi:hypothetical protein